MTCFLTLTTSVCQPNRTFIAGSQAVATILFALLFTLGCSAEKEDEKMSTTNIDTDCWCKVSTKGGTFGFRAQRSGEARDIVKQALALQDHGGERPSRPTEPDDILWLYPSNVGASGKALLSLSVYRGGTVAIVVEGKGTKWIVNDAKFNERLRTFFSAAERDVPSLADALDHDDPEIR